MAGDVYDVDVNYPRGFLPKSSSFVLVNSMHIALSNCDVLETSFGKFIEG